MVQLQKKWRGAGRQGHAHAAVTCLGAAYYTVTAAADAFQMNPIMIHSLALLYSV